eukprot:TRINITY_DN3518_c0_g1_i2.p1 TRINITY_DN3518_c0_g1~~TRINITY_DN3518_c0_g1_i2.p1  ORF type:complete len:1302 (+),score=134.35 TRINITY_DN3518_c0_g1_i2:46-3951(+)
MASPVKDLPQSVVPPRAWRSRFFLTWIGKVVWRMHRGTLGEEDWPLLDTEVSSEEVAQRVLTLWSNEKTHDHSQFRSVRKVLWRLLGGRVALGFIFAISRGVLEQGLLPLLVREVLSVASMIASGEHAQVDATWLAVLASSLALCRLMEATAESLAFYLLMEHSFVVGSSAVSALVLHKTKTVRTSATDAQGLGPQVLLGVDLPRFLARLPLSVMAASSVGGFVAGVALTFLLLGVVPALAGLAWVLVLIVLGTKARNRQTKEERPMAAVTAERMHVMSTMLSTIKGVKLFAWESRYLDVLTRLRNTELRHIVRSNSWWFVGSTVGKAVPITTPLVAFAVFALQGNGMTIADVFAANTIFVQFRRNVDTLAVGVGIVKTMSLTLERVQKYMDMPEVEPLVPLCRQTSDVGAPLAEVPAGRIRYDAREQEASTSLEHVAPEGFELAIGSGGITVRPGELIAICGRVGQGKSTLLAAIAGALADSCRLEGSEKKAARVKEVAYVPQKAFVLSGTVRENLVMCADAITEAKQEGLLNEQLVDVLMATALADDLAALPNGLSEEVGERGTTLSGGQQARVNLARALLSNPQLLAADDPLAAVDSKVAMVLFRSIRSFVSCDPKNRAAVLVVNQSYLLNNFDRIFFVDEGHIAQGDFETLSATNDAFASFVKGIEPTKISDSYASWCEEDVSRCRRLVTESSSAEALAAGKGQLLKVDAVRSGHEVSLSVWMRYARLAGVVLSASLILSEVMVWVCQALRDWWLIVWSGAANAEDDSSFYIGIYAGLSGAQLLFHVLAAICATWGCLRASRALHACCIDRLLKAPVGYFEETPQGLLISRFGTDLSQLDSQVSVYLESGVQIALILVMFAAVVSVRLPWMLPGFLWSIVSFWLPCKAGFRTRVAAKRRSNAAMGPLFSNLVEMEHGSPMIRAMGLHQYFVSRHGRFQDEQARFNVIGMATMNFGRFAVDVSNVLLGIAVTVSLLTIGIDPGDAGVAMSYVIAFGMFILVCNMVFSQLFTWGSNLERMLDIMYGDMPAEVEAAVTSDASISSFEARAGAIEFTNVSLRYREGLPAALKDLSLSIQAGSRVGVIGRTGAGKSTLTSCLFRLVDKPLLSGSILLDGVDIHTLDLKVLRRAMSMIPQEPVLMGGSVRFNLDPFNEFSEDSLKQALVLAHLPNLQLQTMVAAEGSLSGGERQLLCFARALLLRRKVLVADEPTASIDMRTDALVQELLRDAFAGCTLITVAHRLQTILDFDRILVMEAGRVAEDGPPRELIQTPGSLLAGYLAACPQDEDQSKHDTEVCAI